MIVLDFYLFRIDRRGFGIAAAVATAAATGSSFYRWDVAVFPGYEWFVEMDYGLVGGYGFWKWLSNLPNIYYRVPLNFVHVFINGGDS